MSLYASFQNHYQLQLLTWSITLSDIEQMLNTAGESRGLQIDLLDLLQLRQAAGDLFHGSSLFSQLGHINLRPENVSLDRLSLLFGTLAIHSSPNPNPQIMPAFLELSTMMMDNYTEIQRWNYVHTQPLRVYLMIYFANQYCSMTHAIAPFINTPEISPDLFNPLLTKYPTLRRFVHLISLNGEVLETLHTRPYTYEIVQDLESIMCRVCSTIGKPKSPKGDNGQTCELNYEVLVQIHVFCLELSYGHHFSSQKHTGFYP
ncbi:uncharacterized protein A1O9_03991 [Exophiala aquamarina CBS 119918]|uniref:Uncharacterized protein n=1 Tax=Exophiala aquamarina CBS 119918 TaxID=1182545 RepID=A0A072PHC0_9EURO|nr:uncharacterized protein A1O9_03991 [Exophiala aquamarina CBS 119918]KEF59147.1 hypothetical protein A1O9_03991 [Exophiala aquamarina CBS 119918]